MNRSTGSAIVSRNRDGGSASGYRPFPNLAHRNVLQGNLELPALVHLLGVPPGKRVLEVGCGRGVALAPLARLCRPAYLAGLDIDELLLAEAAAKVEAQGVAAQLFQGDVRCMPFADGTFHAVFDFGTCYHVDRSDRALAEITRVLAVGGLFVHETPLGQLLAHPVRSLGRTLPWHAAPRLLRRRTALLWSAREKR